MERWFILKDELAFWINSENNINSNATNTIKKPSSIKTISHKK